MDYLICSFLNHGMKQINSFCLDRNCFFDRRVCNVCLKEGHLDHQENCFQLDRISEIVINQLEKLQSFLETLSLKTLSQELLAKFESLEKELTNAKNNLLKFMPNNFPLAINVAVRCYNNQIEEEIRNLMYEESILNKQYAPCIQSHFEILDWYYKYDKIPHQMNQLISKGDNLIFVKNCKEAIEYYKQASQLAQKKDEIFYILKKAYDALLNASLFDEAKRVSNIIFTIFLSLPCLQQTISKIQMKLEVLKRKTKQFKDFKDHYCFGYPSEIIFFSSIITDIGYELIRSIDQNPGYYGLVMIMLCLQQQTYEKKFKSDIFQKNQGFINIKWQTFPGVIFLEMQNILTQLEFLIIISSAGRDIPPQLKFIFLLYNCMSLARCEKDREALNNIDYALSIYPNQELALYIKGMILIRCGEENEATQRFKKINIVQQNNSQKVLLSSILRYQNKSEEFYETLQTLQKKFIDNNDTYQKLIRFEQWNQLYLQNDIDKLTQALDILESIPTTQKNSQLSILKAVTLLQLNQFDLAEKEIDQAIMLESFNWRDTYYLYYIHGCILAQNRKYLQAWLFFYKASNLRPDFSRVHSCIGLMLMKLNDYEQAIKEFLIAIEHDESSSVRNNLAIAFSQNNEYQYACLQLKTLDPVIYQSMNQNTLAIILIQNAEYDQAIQILQNESNQRGYLNPLLEALSLLGLRAYQRALEIINNIITVNQIWQLYLCKSFALYCLSEYWEALEQIKNVLYNFEQNQEKQQIVTCFLTSLILIKLDRLNEAEQFFNVVAFKIKNENEKYIKILQLQFDLQQQQQHIEALKYEKYEQTFVIDLIVPLIGTLNLRVSEEDIKLKKSKIDWWLLNVDLKDFAQDMWILFDYDQKHQ